jgi:hypothetical protein
MVDLCVDGRIVLKRILNKYSVVCRMGSSGLRQGPPIDCCEHVKELSRSIKDRDFFG